MPLPPLPFLRRALRRARLRGAALLALEVLGEASVRDIARMTGAEARNVAGALVGDEYYRAEDGLVAMGLVRVRVVAGEPLFALSEEGRWAATWWRGCEAAPGPRVGVVLRVP